MPSGAGCPDLKVCISISLNHFFPLAVGIACSTYFTIYLPNFVLGQHLRGNWGSFLGRLSWIQNLLILRFCTQALSYRAQSIWLPRKPRTPVLQHVSVTCIISNASVTNLPAAWWSPVSEMGHFHSTVSPVFYLVSVFIMSFFPLASHSINKGLVKLWSMASSFVLSSDIFARSHRDWMRRSTLKTFDLAPLRLWWNQDGDHQWWRRHFFTYQSTRGCSIWRMDRRWEIQVTAPKSALVERMCCTSFKHRFW